MVVGKRHPLRVRWPVYFSSCQKRRNTSLNRNNFRECSVCSAFSAVNLDLLNGRAVGAAVGAFGDADGGAAVERRVGIVDAAVGRAGAAAEEARVLLPVVARRARAVGAAVLDG